MSKKKKPVKNIKNKEINKKRKLLKENGFIKQDLRKNPTPAQKASITRQWNKYKDFLDGSFSIQKLSKKKLNQLKKKGILTTKDRAFIDKEGYTRVHVGNDFISYSKKGKKRKDLIVADADFLKTIEEQILKSNNVKGQSVMWTTGNGRVLEKRVATYDDFQKYIQNTFSQQLTKAQKEHMKHLPPKKRRAYKNKILKGNADILNNISIVDINRKTTGKKKNANKKQKSRRI